jgi:succinate-acetate transporter protein
MAVGNTFGATALSSYGGFWLSFAIVLTPGGFEIASALGGAGTPTFDNSFGLFLFVSFLDRWMCLPCADCVTRDGSFSLPSCFSAP